MSATIFHRIVDGAIRAARHDHPDITITRSQRRSIVKRAAGTLSALWADTSAAGPSNSASPGQTKVWRQVVVTDLRPGRRRVAKRPSPLGRLKAQISRSLWHVKREEHPEYYRAMVDVLRMVAALKPRDDR